jgi:hypothetical protein
MFYFFEKDHEFVRCEIVEDAGRWRIFITERAVTNGSRYGRD